MDKQRRDTQRRKHKNASIRRSIVCAGESVWRGFACDPDSYATSQTDKPSYSWSGVDSHERDSTPGGLFPKRERIRREIKAQVNNSS